jgi:hypothetical protein
MKTGLSMQTSLNNAPSQVALPDLINAKQLFWLPSLYFILHTLEELPDFAAWVTAHFGPMTTDSFVLSHIPLILLVMLGSYKACMKEAHGRWVIFATAAQ